jgi:site-specific recombinase XerD
VEHLAGLGYTALSGAAQVQLMAHLSRWLDERGLDGADLTPDRVQRFLRDRAACGYVKGRSAKGVGPLLGYLDGLGVVPAPAPSAPTGADRLLGDFADYLRGERGLSARTVSGYVYFARLFVTARASDVDGDRLRLDDLSAEELNAFVLAQSTRRGAGSLANAVTALRALMRFLFLRGETRGGLADVILTPPGWRPGSLPRAVPTDRVARLLAACDRGTATGRRDHAILIVLARLGLRAGEVGALSLEDVNWRTGELTVPGKGGRREPLPVPADVGRAIADYCRHGRPRRADRALFLAERAPFRALSAQAVTAIVYRACERAAVPRVSAHQLRHTVGTETRRAGAPLEEVGQLLRHRFAGTTAIYATVQSDELSGLARPWPGATA